MRRHFAAGLIVGAALTCGVAFGIGLSVAQPTPPTAAAVRDLRWELDVLHGKTEAGIEYCRDVNARLHLQRTALGAGE